MCPVISDCLWPFGLEPARLLCTWDFLGKNTRVDCHFLLQGIFLTKGSNLCILYCRHIPAGTLPAEPFGKYPKYISCGLFLNGLDYIVSFLVWVFLSLKVFSSVQSLSCVRLFATPWIAAHQASLSITNSWSSLRLTSIESVMPSSHLILCRPLLLLPPIPPSISLFQWVNSSHEVAKVLEFQL